MQPIAIYLSQSFYSRTLSHTHTHTYIQTHTHLHILSLSLSHTHTHTRTCLLYYCGATQMNHRNQSRAKNRSFSVAGIFHSNLFHKILSIFYFLLSDFIFVPSLSTFFAYIKWTILTLKSQVLVFTGGHFTRAQLPLVKKNTCTCNFGYNKQPPTLEIRFLKWNFARQFW